MSEQGYYDVTLHTGPGIVQAHVTFPFGQWAELGYWLDEIAPGEQDTLTVTFHPLRSPGLHSVRAELHEGAGLLDLEAPQEATGGPLRRLGMQELLEAAGIDGNVYDHYLAQEEARHGLGDFDGGQDDPPTGTED